MRQRQKVMAGEPAHVHLVARQDRVTLLEQQMRMVCQELRVQLTRIAQLQVQLDSTRHALDTLTDKQHRR